MKGLKKVAAKEARSQGLSFQPKYSTSDRQKTFNEKPENKHPRQYLILSNEVLYQKLKTFASDFRIKAHPYVF